MITSESEILERVARLEDGKTTLGEQVSWVNGELSQLSKRVGDLKEFFGRGMDRLWKLKWVVLGSIWTTIVILVIGIVVG